MKVAGMQSAVQDALCLGKASLEHTRKLGAK